MIAPDHLTGVEAAWDAIAIAGLLFSALVMTRYARSRRAARAVEDPADRVVAMRMVWDYILSEIFRAAEHTISLVMGIWSSFVPVLPAPHFLTGGQARFSAGVILGFIAVNLLTAANSARAYYAWTHRYGLVAHGRRVHSEHGTIVQ